MADVLLDVDVEIRIVPGVRQHQGCNQVPDLVGCRSVRVANCLGLRSISLGRAVNYLVEEFLLAPDVVVKRCAVGAQALGDGREACAAVSLLPEHMSSRGDNLITPFGVCGATLGKC